jgi:hypothetical protein
MTKILMFKTNSPLGDEDFLACFEPLSIRISDLTCSTVRGNPKPGPLGQDSLLFPEDDPI